MTQQNRKRLPVLIRLLVPALAALLPLFALAGSTSPGAAAALPPAREQATRPSDTAKTLIIRVYFKDAAERDRVLAGLARRWLHQISISGPPIGLPQTAQRYLFRSQRLVEIGECRTGLCRGLIHARPSALWRG